MNRIDWLVGSCSLWLSKVGGDPVGAVPAVRDHHDLAWSCHHVDADDAVQLALGLGDPGVAGAGDDVHGRDAVGAIGERGNGLRAADAPQFVHARDVRGGEDERVDLAIGGGGDHHDTLDPCDLGGNRVHQH